jgi:hypothetical protein
VASRAVEEHAAVCTTLSSPDPVRLRAGSSNDPDLQAGVGQVAALDPHRRPRGAQRVQAVEPRRGRVGGAVLQPPGRRVLRQRGRDGHHQGAPALGELTGEGAPDAAEPTGDQPGGARAHRQRSCGQGRGVGQGDRLELEAVPLAGAHGDDSPVTGQQLGGDGLDVLLGRLGGQVHGGRPQPGELAAGHGGGAERQRLGGPSRCVVRQAPGPDRHEAETGAVALGEDPQGVHGGPEPEPLRAGEGVLRRGAGVVRRADEHQAVGACGSGDGGGAADHLDVGAEAPQGGGEPGAGGTGSSGGPLVDHHDPVLPRGRGRRKCLQPGPRRGAGPLVDRQALWHLDRQGLRHGGPSGRSRTGVRRGARERALPRLDPVASALEGVGRERHASTAAGCRDDR